VQLEKWRDASERASSDPRRVASASHRAASTSRRVVCTSSLKICDLGVPMFWGEITGHCAHRFRGSTLTVTNQKRSSDCQILRASVELLAHDSNPKIQNYSIGSGRRQLPSFNRATTCSSHCWPCQVRRRAVRRFVISVTAFGATSELNFGRYLPALGRADDDDTHKQPD
jgi:hypothetical protein